MISFYFPLKYIVVLLSFEWLQVLFGANVGVVPDDTIAYANVVVSDRSIRMPKPDEDGIATRYGDPGDIYGQGGTACAPHDKINDVDHVCAHRWYPCGTILVVENQKTNERNWCVVKDRGPYGANVFAADGTKVMANGRPAWYIKIHKDDLPPGDLCPGGECTGRWRGVLDMSPAVSKGMGHTGWGSVKVWRLKRVVDLQRYLSKKSLKPTS